MGDDDEKKDAKKPRYGEGRRHNLRTRAKRELIRRILAGETMDDALAACHASRPQLSNTRTADPEWAERLDKAMAERVSDDLYEKAKSGAIGAARTFLFNKSGGVYRPDLGNSLIAREQPSQRAAGGHMRDIPKRLIIHTPKGFNQPDEILEVNIGRPKELSAPEEAAEVLPIAPKADAEEGVIVTPAELPTQQPVECPAPSEATAPAKHADAP